MSFERVFNTFRDKQREQRKPCIRGTWRRPRTWPQRRNRSKRRLCRWLSACGRREGQRCKSRWQPCHRWSPSGRNRCTTAHPWRRKRSCTGKEAVKQKNNQIKIGTSKMIGGSRGSNVNYIIVRISVNCFNIELISCTRESHSTFPSLHRIFSHSNSPCSTLHERSSRAITNWTNGSMDIDKNKRHFGGLWLQLLVVVQFAMTIIIYRMLVGKNYSLMPFSQFRNLHAEY